MGRTTRTDRVLGRFFVVLLLIAGPVLILISLHIRAQERAGAGWITTSGIVVGVHHVSGIRGDDVSRPVVAFRDRAGSTHRITAPAGNASVGQTVRVSFDPRDPSKARDLSAGGWAGGFAAGVVMVVLAGLAIGLALWLRVRSARPGTRSP